jgi:transcriptional regulator
MYIPKSFNIDDRQKLHAFIQRYSFATLVTGGDEPFATHLPFLLDPDRGPHGTLVGHFARANPHWKMDHLRLGSVAIFHGPHAYISPSWYRSGTPAVPTWNYAAVHATGKLNLIEDESAAITILRRMVQTYDSSPDALNIGMHPEITAKLLPAIIAFEIPIDRLEGKFKLGQNRQPADQIGAIEGLESAGDAESLALARFAREELNLQS